MPLTKKILWLCCLVFSTTCAELVTPSPITPFASSAPEIAASTQTSGQATAVPPVSSAEYLAAFLPKCEGIEILKDPLVFDWPNIKKRTKDLADGHWGYFSCSQKPADVVALYQANLINTPYNMVETAWVERQQGFLGLYLYTPSYTWFYIWVIPQPGNPAASFVIVVQVDESIFTPGNCRLRFTETYC